MIPALIGKVAGWTAGNIALLIWSIWGIILVYLGLCFALRAMTAKKMMVILLIFITWSGLNILGLGNAEI